MARARALNTNYGGCTFRSRLEARWAVLFDMTGTPWCYEPQGYVVDGYAYLPDFWLPSLDSYFEVKGFWDDSVRKAMALAASLDDQGFYLAVGDIPNPTTLAAQGWSNQTGQIATLTTNAFPWASWFPQDLPAVQIACAEARSARFDAVSGEQPRNRQPYVACRRFDGRVPSQPHQRGTRTPTPQPSQHQSSAYSTDVPC